MRIRKKLALLVTVPLVAVVAFAGLALVPTAQDAMQADRLRGLTLTSAAAGELVDHLQRERAAAVMMRVEGSEETAEAFEDQTVETDASVDEYLALRAEVTNLSDDAETMLEEVDDRLERLGPLRELVQQQTQTLSATVFAYRIVIAELLSYREAIAQIGEASAEVANWLRAASAMSEGAERMGLQQVAVALAADRDAPLSAMNYREISAARTAHDEAMLEFAALSKPEWDHLLDHHHHGSEQDDHGEDHGDHDDHDEHGDEHGDHDDHGDEAHEDTSANSRLLQDSVGRINPGEPFELDDIAVWTAVIGHSVQDMMAGARTVDEDIITDVTEQRDVQLNWALGQAAGIALVLIVVLALALWLGRPVMRGLRRLRDSARNAALHDLPMAVKQVDDQENLGQLTPEEFAEKVTPPLTVKGNDELAEVGAAFNEVHREAIRVAAQQALLRAQVAAVFVRLARRGHSLTGRLTATLDEAERDEQDPDRLQQLFRLDHLVSLLGRANDSLLVLGGASPAKVRFSDQKLSDVLTAAQSHIEHYTRVNFGLVDEGVWVTSDAVDDVVQLLAELMDNATRYSEQNAEVVGRFLADRVVIQVRDFGIGVEPQLLEKLNDRLSTSAPLNMEAMQAMGLTVVGHLASRHGIEVKLRKAVRKGTIAEVSLPRAVLSFAGNPDSERRGPAEIAAEPAPSPQSARSAASQAAPAPRREAPLFHGGGDSGAGTTSHVVRADQVEPAPRTMTSDVTAGLPVVQFDRQAVSAEDPLRAGSALPKREAAATEAGLPKRDPMTQLVPGAVAPTTEREDEPIQRDPATVGATYAAYARGLANKPTTQDSDDPRTSS